MSKLENNNENSFGYRLGREMKGLGLTQEALAARLGVSQSAVSGWLNYGHQPRRKIIEILADCLGITSAWLMKGTEPRLNARSLKMGEPVGKTVPRQFGFLRETPSRRTVTNADPMPAGVLMVPVLSWAQAGLATDFETLPEDWQEFIPAAVTDSRSFAITLRGDSMEPKYQDGDVAILLPQSVARNGDLVVVNIKDEGFAFKVMTLIGGDPNHVRLTSFNLAYPPMEFKREQFHWIYPVHSVNKVVRK